MKINWKSGIIPVSAEVSGLETSQGGWTSFDLSLAFRTGADEREVMEFVAQSLAKNGIRYWDDDNALTEVRNGGSFVTFRVANSPLTMKALRRSVIMSRIGDLVRVRIPCHGA